MEATRTVTAKVRPSARRHPPRDIGNKWSCAIGFPAGLIGKPPTLRAVKRSDGGNECREKQTE